MMHLLHAPGKIPLFSEVILMAALAWMVSGWLLPSSDLKFSSLPTNKAPSTAPLPDLTQLIAVPLFGKAATPDLPPQSVAQTPEPILISPLSIKLLGTVVAEEHGAAIIALAQGREQRVFFIGDQIQPGVTLKTVEADAIVVDRGGKLERVSLEHGAKLITSPAVPVRTASPVPQTTNMAPIPPHRFPPAQVTRKNITRNQLNRQLKNFPALLSQARVLPRIINGKPNGFTISEITPGSLYQQIGLQNGDIILNVNGKRITGAKQAMGMYQALQTAAAIDLELIRAGQNRRIHYNIR